MDTEQVNFRISKQLLEEIDRISSELGVSRSEWIKMRLAEHVQYEKKKVEYYADKERCAVRKGKFKGWSN